MFAGALATDVVGGVAVLVVLLAVGAVAFVAAIAARSVVAISLIVAVAINGAGNALAIATAFLSESALYHRWQGRFLTAFIPIMILVCLVPVPSLARLSSWWGIVGPILLFLGLLTLLNAPFDWASLGLTRALLRRGLELKMEWWPYIYAVIDACLATVVIALLALTMVLGVQAFDELAVHGGGTKAAVLPLDQLFDGISKHPEEPEYWWVYALLLSTMIPSLVNLAIGGMALTRGIPGVPRLLLRWIPEGRDVPDYRRPLAALALTIQMFAGAFLGIAAQAFLAVGLLYYLMPAIGLDLLWLCQQLAGLDLPGKFFHLTGIIR